MAKSIFEPRMRAIVGSLVVPALAIGTLLTVASSARLEAQSATATIIGAVTDASGAAVQEATITVRNVDTGLTVSAASDSQGRFRASELSIGNYEVQASKTGFSTVVHKGITLNVGSENTLDFVLPVGQQQQTVTVEAEVSQVETTSATVGSLTDQKQMRELPLNGRNFEQLILLTPGVQSITAFQAVSLEGRANEYSVAGSRPTGQAILLDDENLQNFWNKGMGSITGSSLGVEAIAEFQTLTNTYSAQFGGNGAVINSVSKSGTNSIHGSGFEFLRNSALDARSFIDGPSVPAFRRNQFGGSIGGPVKRDKMFFFGAYEGIRQALGETKIAFVPDCTASSAFTGGACTPSPTLPVTTQQAIINTLKIFPSPLPGTVSASGIGSSTQVAAQIAHENYALGRFDYNISAKDGLFVRYISDKADFIEPFGGGGFAGGPLPFWPESDTSHGQFMTAEWRRILSPTLINVVRASFSRPTTVAFTTGSTPPLQFFPGSGRQDGGVTITGLSGLGGATPLPFNESQNRFTEGDDIVWTHGAHTLKFGMSVSRLQSNTYMPFRQGSSWSFQGLGQFLAGTPFTLTWPPLTLANGQPAYANRDFRQIDLTPYFQEDWKVSPKLTLNLGLRWEFSTNPVDNHNALYAITNFATATGFVNVPHVMVSNASWKNFAPRVGFAYAPWQKTSIRGGFGIFYDDILPPVYTPAYWDQPPYATVSVGLNVPGSTPPLYPNVPTNGSGSLPTTSPGFDWNNHTTPYMMQYNLNIQREIAQGTVLSVGYVGSRGIHLMSQIEQNPGLVTIDSSGVQHFGTITATGTVKPNARLNQALGAFPDMVPIATSKYNSLQASLVRRFARNFQTQVSYTWSKCMDNGGNFGSFASNAPALFENPYNANVDRSACSFDITHVLSLNGLVALPFHGNRLIEGWQLSGIVRATSGVPFTVTDGVDASGLTTSSSSTRPNVNPGFSNNPILGTPAQWFNPAAFSLAPLTTLGNLGRNTLRGPDLTSADLALLKDTKVWERVNVQFRAEFFNIFNHSNYALPTSTLYTAIVNGAGVPNPQAGRITGIVGTPRQIQFGLKFIF